MANLSMIIRLGLLVMATLIFLPPAFAVDTETLPARIRMAQLKTGFISGLDQVWASNGNLYNLGETRSVTFDGPTLARVSPEAAALVQALNQFGSRQLGDQVQLGTLNIHTVPEVSYFAPVFAYGINDRWTVGFGIPVVRYNNQLSLTASASNLSFYRDSVGGNVQLIENALNVNLVQETQKVVAEKGYQPLSSRRQTFLGDVQVAALHRLRDWGRWNVLHQMTLILPTGPKDDPNDLLAINAFARTNFENTLVLSRPLDNRWTFLPYASLNFTLPDQVVKRVPRNPDDVLPDQSSSREVLRMIAPVAALGSEVRYSLTDSWQFKGGLEGCVKGRDQYQGSGRVDLLSNNSDFEVARVRGGVGYSSVNAFKSGRAKVPARLAVDVSDTLMGRNIERQLRTDVSAMLFF